MKLIRSCALICLALMLFAFGAPKAVHKKVVKEVEKTFDVEGVSFSPISVSQEVNQDLPAKITGENFYKVTVQNKPLGFAFVDQAPSKTAKFDYLVVFDTELKVVNSKVLVYREEYGGEIGSKRWLKQFLGKTGNDRVSSETNIDAIAGATISVRSMTKSMDNLLQTIGILQKNGNL